MLGPERFAALPRRALEELALDGPAVVRELRAMREDGAPFLPASIRVPALVVRGTRSFARHRRSAAELAAAIPGARLAEIDGARHDAHRSHAAELAVLVRELAAGVAR